jgi:hypothetical protein
MNQVIGGRPLIAYGGYVWLRTDRSAPGRAWARRRLFSAASPAASPNRASARDAKRSAGVNARLAAGSSRWRLGIDLSGFMEDGC